jgi:dihydroorotate dehydrogenase
VNVYQSLARPALFRLGGGDAEAAHEWTLRRLSTVARQPRLLSALRSLFAVADPVELFGLRFGNRVGLAAGLDKDGRALPAWPALGFGFVEVGTVTRHAQPGNDRPRLFRLPGSRALINRMGFNNAGAAALADRLASSAPLPVPLGISLGKSKVTPLADAVEDYVSSLRALYPYGDYFAVNVSSPNTPGLRDLQDRAHLTDLLATLQSESAALSRSGSAGDGPPPTDGPAAGVGRGGRPKPLLLKIAPDLTDTAIASALRCCVDHGLAGVIATNTTLSRTGLAAPDVARGAETGGLSGAPLAARARDVVAFAHRELAGALPIIGVGGILEPDDALRLVDAGASLVQLYTGLIYGGPALIRATARTLATPGTRPTARPSASADPSPSVGLRPAPPPPANRSKST